MRELDHYDTFDVGGYEDEKGHHYDTLGELLQEGILGFCGCGNPEQNLLLIHQLLTKHEDGQKKRSGLPYQEGHVLFCMQEEELKKFAQDNWEGLLRFFWYVMAEKNITNHGGSIPGWVEDRNFMDALEKWKIEYEKGNSDE